MRLKYAYYILKECLDCIYSINKRKSTGIKRFVIGNMYYIPNYRHFKSALIRTQELSIIEDDMIYSILSKLENSNMRIRDGIKYYDGGDYDEFQGHIDKLTAKIETVINFCNKLHLVSTQTTHGFDIKMPMTNDLEEFSSNISKLSKAISTCPYLAQETEKIELRKTDIGSIWFEFAIVGAVASPIILHNLACIVDKCNKIRSHKVTIKQQEEELRAAKLKNDLLNELVESNKKIIDSIVNMQIDELKQEITNVTLDHEETERVRNTLNTITKLMDKGMEVYAAIDAPKEIKDLFPTYDQSYLSLGSIKQLQPQQFDEQT